MNTKTIYLTEQDYMALRHLLGAADRKNPSLNKFREELGQAKVLNESEFPKDVVALNTRVELVDLDDNQKEEYVIVMPMKADPDRQRISVLAPVGIALLGYRVGESVEWPTPGGVRNLKVLSVTHEDVL
ncbi:MAG: GreA/GreB family elongation factor [Puniceicoccales bacterium]|jgi:regulator of nucleoside diphosphate kinase|nr:GreA/GreB family elongation factor [Puniceicoccales bacterium]